MLLFLYLLRLGQSVLVFCEKPDESIKITIKFLSNEVRSDAIDVDVFYKKCISTNNCMVNKQDGQLKKEITKQILAKATIYRKQIKDKNFEPYIMSIPGE